MTNTRCYVVYFCPVLDQEPQNLYLIELNRVCDAIPHEHIGTIYRIRVLKPMKFDVYSDIEHKQSLSNLV